MTERRQPTVAVTLHDGFYGCGTGAGRFNRALLTILAGLLPNGVRLVVFPVYLDPPSPEYDPTWHAETTTLLAHVDATVHPVDNGTAGQVRFGGLNCFRHLVRHTAEVLTRYVLPDARPVLILALDAPFLGLAPLLPTHAVPNLVLVPRSTARIHAPADRERIAWESHGLRTATDHGGRIAAISSYLGAHLNVSYQVPSHALVELPNGLSPADWQLTTPGDDAILPAPARDGFLLAMGRAQPYKGFDALALLRQRDVAVPHLVLAAVTDNPDPSIYQQHLAKRITRLRLSATLLTQFHPDVRRLLKHPALRGVVVPSRAEPFGRVPIEAYAAGATPVIATTAGGLTEQVIDGHTGFTAAPEDPVSLAAALLRALTLTSAEQHRIREEARRFAASRYDYPHTVNLFLKQVAPWLDRQLDGGQQLTRKRASMRYRACIDVHLILRRGEQILLGQRQNTGFADGSWHLPSGHTEDGKSATAALIRETEEEIGVRIEAATVRFAQLMHHRTDSGRIALFFEVTRWDGEPDKCARWDWFTLTDLPTDMIPYAAQAVTHYTKGEVYAERNWD